MRIFEKQTSLSAKAAAGEGVPVNVAGFRDATMAIRGTFVADIIFKASLDGITWYDIVGRDVSDANHSFAKKITAPKLIQFRDIGGIQFLRADVDAYTSGAVTAEVTGDG